MRRIRIAVLVLVAASSLPLRGGPSEVRSGHRLAYALTGARVIVAPGRIIENDVVVVRGGVIGAAGPPGQTAIPADARIFDLKGKVVHAAFIDPYVPADRLAGKRPRGPSDDEESAEPGRDATLIVTDGDILDLRSNVLAAYLDGRALDLTDKQKRLYERYRNRPMPASR